MSLETANRISRSVLYEGYLLYPYYPSSMKNRQRWNFGGLYPRRYVAENPIPDHADRSELQAEFLIEKAAEASCPKVEVRLRFLQLIARMREALMETPVAADSWEEACERERVTPRLELDELTRREHRLAVSFPAMDRIENGMRRVQMPLEGLLSVSAREVSETLFRVRVRVANTSDRKPRDRAEALLYSMVSTHLLLISSEGQFVSLIEPPELWQSAAARCQNQGTWPVLVGRKGERGILLCAPIILYDYPQIAPESPGDLFDGAEIDEILSLRILTLTAEEKLKVRASDRRARELLERTERLTEDELLRLHGRLRELRPESVRVDGQELRPGDRVRLRPKRRSDIYDLVLAGMIARVESVEQDLEGGFQLCVTLDDDPGKDLGALGQPGHRFYFGTDEVEVL